MKNPRETYYAALFARVADASSFQTKERRVRHWNDVSPEEMPYVGMSQDGETPVKKRGLPYHWVLRVTLYVYVRSNAEADPTVVPAQILNPILDAVETALAATEQDTNEELVNTLGGLVYDCRIAGPIETSEGMLGDLEYALIPVEIVVPS